MTLIGRTIKGPDASGTKAWLSPDHRAEVLAESKGTP